ncbi:divergent 4Fe-4S mono-cluster protein [Leptospira meyeri]|uniref:Divergent 4Fe-4S mono-cluster protein n=1 Tax=Leptospira meyeri TaxID=29508 RepID=A0A4R8MQB2_LEPME|nr:(4Fe-4S)-binding protein [Leptospira meyeri]TDY67172.1 divergent 4Fe-4S mono-cluster protein [Leptospira meyeri]
MDNEIIKKYSNEDITVVWKPNVCIHSTICFKGLPGVFDRKRKPLPSFEGNSFRKKTQ